MDFDTLYAEAIAEWPPRLSLKTTPAGTGYVVEGLVALSERISVKWKGSPQEVFMFAMHWAIVGAVHEAFGSVSEVEMARLEPPRKRFENALVLVLDNNCWSEDDHQLVRDYFAAAGRQPAGA
jgi:hypothetical protein